MFLNFKNRTQSRMLALICAGLLLLTSCSDPFSEAGDNPDLIKVGMSGSYFPFTFSKQGKLQGFEVDLWREIERRLNRPVTFVTANFSGLFGMLETGKIDTISNQITKTADREQKYLFSNPYAYDGAQIIIHENNDSIQGFHDLCGKVVLVSLGSNYENLIRAKDTKKCINVKMHETNLELDVIIGRADAFIMDRSSIIALTKKNKLPLKLVGEPIEFLENALPFLKIPNGKALQQHINQVLDSMREDGTLNRLSLRWFNADITTKNVSPRQNTQS